MICVYCKTGDPTSGRTTVTFDREGVTIVIRNVPARICPQCGEQYFDADTTDRLLENDPGSHARRRQRRHPGIGGRRAPSLNRLLFWGRWLVSRLTMARCSSSAAWVRRTRTDRR